MIVIREDCVIQTVRKVQLSASREGAMPYPTTASRKEHTDSHYKDIWRRKWLVHHEVKLAIECH